MRLISLCFALVLAQVGLGQDARAQEALFAPRLIVNDRAITEYEFFQRRLFLTLLRAEGDIEAAAEEALIEDRLRMDAAERLEVSVSDEQVLAGMEEFASRANLSAEEFVEAIGKAGVEPETFRDFVEAGLVWRDVVRARFGGQVTISEAEIDRALAETSQRGVGARVLLSEMIIPAPAHRIDEVQALAARLSATIRSEAAFAAAARTYSSAVTAEKGGDLGWIAAANLPPFARAALAAVRPGQVTPPVPIPGSIALFYLRDLREPGPTAPEGAYVEYAEFLIPGGRSPAALAEAAGLRARVDVCSDLYGVAKGLAENRLTIISTPVANLPGDVAREIATLDEGESSTALTRGGALLFLMLCKRQAGAPLDLPSREAIRAQLVNERLNGYAEGFLADLRADAIIRYP